MVETDVPPQDDPAAERTARHQAILKELAEIGMDIARALRGQAEADPKAGADLAFSRVARAIRQTLALEARLADEGFARAQAEAVRLRKLKDSQELTRRLRRVQRETTIHRLVTEAIKTEAEEIENDDRVETLIDRLDDAMHILDLSDDRPIGAIVQQICQDLGVPICWSRIRDEPWALEERRERPPGSPFANGVPRAIWPDWSQYDPDQIPPYGTPEYDELARSLTRPAYPNPPLEPGPS